MRVNHKYLPSNHKAKGLTSFLCIFFVFPTVNFPEPVSSDHLSKPITTTTLPNTAASTQSTNVRASIAAAILAFTAASVSARHSKLRAYRSTCLLSTVSNPDATAVENAINQWASDGSTVNTFLNVIEGGGLSNPDDLLAATQAVFLSAQDEPCQFQTLKKNPDAPGAIVVPKFSCAISDLDSVFGPHVLDNLNAIIADPSNTETVTAAVADINVFRCCDVLPDVDTLFLDSAVDFGIANQVPLSVPRENACANIQCTPACDGLDNGSAGK